MSTRLHDLLAERDYLIADGATGTNLFAMGLQSGDAPELWNVDYPDRVRALYQGWVDAGSDIFLTNTFGANRYRLKLHAAEDRVRELNMAAVRIGREVADATDRPVVVAGSMGPTGEIFEPVGSLSLKDGEEAFAEQAAAQAEAGVDVHWIETISGREELEAAISGASRTGLPVVATMTFDTAGRTMMGLTPEQAAGLGASLSEDLKGGGHIGLMAFGANCGVGPGTLIDSVQGIGRALHNGPIVVAKGNCGIPRYEDGEIVYSGTPEIMADYARLARDAGARIIGGCCGTTPVHIEAMIEALKNHTPGGSPSREAIEAALGPIDMPKPTADGGAGEARAARRKRRRG
ncbi:MAG: betaine--homocysteine S-methyltransferase [Rhodospirillales bacterium]